MKGVEHIGKDKKNAQQGYNFRGIDDMYNYLHNLFAEEGVIILPSAKELQREERPSKGGGMLIWTLLTINFKFMASDGSTEIVEMRGEAMDSGDKGCNKANSIALKYALMQMFLIPTEELKNEDPDGQTPKIESPEKIMKDECLALIAKADSVDDLKTLKEMYKDLFTKDDEVKKTGTKRFNELSKANKS